MPLRHACIFIFVLVSLRTVLAQPASDPYSYTAIAGFANHCIEQKEYYRAYQEYNRLHAYYPSLYSYEALNIASLYCKYEGRQYKLILDQINSNLRTQPSVWLFAFDSAFSVSSPVLNNIVQQSPAIESSNSEYEAMILKRKLAYSLATEDNYNELSPYTVLAQDFDLQRIYEFSRFKRDALKNPVAALSWGIIPGAGYIYSDNLENGIIAAIVIGVCAAVTWFAVDTGNVSIAVFTGAAGTFFYGGSILGGYLAAKKANSQVMKEMHAYLEEELKFAKDREIIFLRYGKPKTQ